MAAKHLPYPAEVSIGVNPHDSWGPSAHHHDLVMRIEEALCNYNNYDVLRLLQDLAFELRTGYLAPAHYVLRLLKVGDLSPMAIIGVSHEQSRCWFRQLDAFSQADWLAIVKPHYSSMEKLSREYALTVRRLQQISRLHLIPEEQRKKIGQVRERALRGSIVATEACTPNRNALRKHEG